MPRARRAEGKPFPSLGHGVKLAWLLARHPWIAYAEAAIIACVAVTMIADGAHEGMNAAAGT